MCEWPLIGILNAYEPMTYSLLRQFSRRMFCYANQMSKALPRKRHAELEELDFKL